MPFAKSARLFIVDDDAGLVRLMQKTLDREGYVTSSASSGKEAIGWLANNDANLMLLDLKLQDMQGHELVEKLTSVRRDVPFIIITGQGDERVAVEMMKRGALDYIVKDTQFIEFVPTVVRRALEKLETARRLSAAQAALEESKTQLLNVSEREQRRFGAELHDNLGQQLTAIELRCEGLLHDLPQDRPDLRQQLDQIGQYLREAISQTRKLARGLSPVRLGAAGLHEALAELASRFTKASRKCALEFDEEVVVLDDAVAGHIFRIAQEAVTNAVKHSGATDIAIRFGKIDGSMHLEVSDNGKGFVDKPVVGQGIGLELMRHRAKIINATLDIESKPNHGVTVTCTLPK
ncbi:MAG: response regulator [Limisphaerales bacterium]